MDKVSSSYHQLLEFSRTLKTLDSHEHLIPEAERLNRRIDFSMFIEMYVPIHLKAAGMPDHDLFLLFEHPDTTEDERFNLFEPWKKYISQSSFYRAARIAIKELYGFDDITRDNYRELGKSAAINNTPGLYKRVLKEHCGLGNIINQKVHYNNESNLFYCNNHVGFYQGPVYNEMLERFREQGVNIEISDLDSYNQALENLFSNWDSCNFLGLKSGIISRDYLKDSAATNRIIQKMVRSKSISANESYILHAWGVDFFFKKAKESGRVFCFHTGPVLGQQDFRHIAPGHIMPWAIAYPEVKIDLYHMGLPEPAKAGFIASTYPNVMLNLCWSHVVGETMTGNALAELLDTVPVNKIIGFGGDYSGCVECVYGALELARINVCSVLADRIERGIMDLEDGKFITGRIFVDNGEQWYGLKGETYA